VSSLIKGKYRRNKNPENSRFSRNKKLSEIEEDLIKEPITEDDEKLCTASRVARHATNEEILAEVQQKLKRTRLRTDEEIWKEMQENGATPETQKKETSKITEIQENESSKITETSDSEIKHVHFNSNDSSTSTDDEIEPPLQIKFKFSKNISNRKFDEHGGYSTPWDIEHNYKLNKTKKKSILKPAKAPSGNW